VEACQRWWLKYLIGEVISACASDASILEGCSQAARQKRSASIHIFSCLLNQQDKAILDIALQNIPEQIKNRYNHVKDTT
jgi:hypothetical protein